MQNSSGYFKITEIQVNINEIFLSLQNSHCAQSIQTPKTSQKYILPEQVFFIVSIHVNFANQINWETIILLSGLESPCFYI